ncbi:hypothetical protein GOP47_0026119 [Adiantum capillus-veneris]|uniref:Uncharacterized protein n=1 Tax=Adiantum capillus-veneris TaxID=13818 RepID=A0A9D4Z3G4_ADICA|nr:hypothetical protein GOP47_0025687 [Adiantum capillus-veneris]KAI5059800.1 hypothetical protein GOP47_0026119 [Adiantum capillus-veneris]
MSRRCSHCGHNGHNSRTCLDMKGGFKLFGVRLAADSLPSGAAPSAESSSSSSTIMRKSFSMGNLCNYGSPDGAASPPLSASPVEQPDLGDAVEGYASDDLVHASSNPRERKKGIPWTEEEHRSFLIGLQKLGKGDWRGISRNFVKTRTPTQVASHAQKYFLRRNNLTKRRRRSSLFDITPDTVSSLLGETVLEEEAGCADADVCPELSLGQSIPYGNGRMLEPALFSQQVYRVGGFSGAISRPSLTSATMKSIPETNETSEMPQCNDLEVDERHRQDNAGHATSDIDVMEAIPEVSDNLERSNRAFPHFPPIAFWPGQGLYGVPYADGWARGNNLVKPTPIIPRPPVEIAESMRLGDLQMNATRPVMEPTPLSYKLLEEGSRQSAFHTMSQPNSNQEIDAQGSVSSAISVP